MIIQRTADELIIRLPENISFTYLQEFLDYLKVRTLVAKSQATEAEIEALSEQILSDWWAANQHAFARA